MYEKSINIFMSKDIKKVVLCGGKKCCPELTINKQGKVEIKDNYGNTVIMDRNQAKMVTGAVEKLEKQQ